MCEKKVVILLFYGSEDKGTSVRAQKYLSIYLHVYFDLHMAGTSTAIVGFVKIDNGGVSRALCVCVCPTRDVDVVVRICPAKGPSSLCRHLDGLFRC